MLIFAAAALVLAAVGVYGVMAYAVSVRSREIGVRMALGARRDDILRSVLREAMISTALGVTMDIAAALSLGRSLEALLFGVTAHDAATLLLVSATLALVAGAAALVPALRASRLSPMRALRLE